MADVMSTSQFGATESAAFRAEALRKSNEEMRRRIQELKQHLANEKMRTNDAQRGKVLAVHSASEMAEVSVFV